MTNEEAKTCIKANICYKQEVCADGICKSTEKGFCAIDVAIEALEKQIPKKPITDKYYCKCSNGHNIPVICKNGKMKYCPMCGQAIDWNEVE